MANFSEVVAFSRDAQLRQAERERNDQAFVEDVMTAVREQVEEGGGSLSATGEWTRLSENTMNTYQLTFPDGCNVQEVQLAVAGHVEARKNVFMVGPTNRNAEPKPVKDRAEAASLVFDYLLNVVKEIRQLHER